MTVERGKGWEMHLGDCLEVMATLEKVDHVITDPPYEAEAHKHASRSPKPGQHVNNYAIPFNAITEEQRAAVAAECGRLAASWALVFCQLEGVNPWRDALVSAGGKWRRAAVWVKPDSAPQFTGDRWAQSFECIGSAWFGKGKSTWNGGGRRAVFTHCVNSFGRLTNGRPHPTQKPDALMIELVGLFSGEGETILDPYAGSASTGVACLRLGRQFIGIEKDPTYFALACERLRAEEQGSTLQAARVGQLPLLG